MKRKQVPVSLVTENVKGLSTKTYTSSTYKKCIGLEKNSYISLPLNRISFKIALKIEGLQDRSSSYGYDFYKEARRKRKEQNENTKNK